jgi:hypothetical protein
LIRSIRVGEFEVTVKVRKSSPGNDDRICDNCFVDIAAKALFCPEEQRPPVRVPASRL